MISASNKNGNKDEDGTRAVLTGVLQDTFSNAVIKTARSNQEAFRILEDFYPDIVITDFYHLSHIITKEKKCPVLT